MPTMLFLNGLKNISFQWKKIFCKPLHLFLFTGYNNNFMQMIKNLPLIISASIFSSTAWNTNVIIKKSILFPNFQHYTSLHFFTTSSTTVILYNSIFSKNVTFHTKDSVVFFKSNSKVPKQAKQILYYIIPYLKESSNLYLGIQETEVVSVYLHGKFLQKDPPTHLLPSNEKSHIFFRNIPRS